MSRIAKDGRLIGARAASRTYRALVRARWDAMNGLNWADAPERPKSLTGPTRARARRGGDGGVGGTVGDA